MTFLGNHTRDEVLELIKAKDFDIAKIQAAADSFLPTWDTIEVGDSAQWAEDWATLLRRYAAAKEIARHSLTPEVLIGPADSERDWNNILRAIRVDPDTHHATDLQVLYTRLVDAMGKQVDFSGQPQPKVEDSDLVFFQDTTPIANLVETGVDLGKSGLDTTTKVLLGVGIGVLGVALLRR